MKEDVGNGQGGRFTTNKEIEAAFFSFYLSVSSLSQARISPLLSDRRNRRQSIRADHAT